MLAEYTMEELMIEYLEDQIEADPAEEFPRNVQDSGLYLHKTGDAVFDDWQLKAATGERIDFTEAFDSDAKQQFEGILEASKKRHQAKVGLAQVPDEVHDDYTGR